MWTTGLLPQTVQSLKPLACRASPDHTISDAPFARNLNCHQFAAGCSHTCRRGLRCRRCDTSTAGDRCALGPAQQPGRQRQPGGGCGCSQQSESRSAAVFHAACRMSGQGTACSPMLRLDSCRTGWARQGGALNRHVPKLTKPWAAYMAGVNATGGAESRAQQRAHSSRHRNSWRTQQRQQCATRVLCCWRRRCKWRCGRKRRHLSQL